MERPPAPPLLQRLLRPRLLAGLVAAVCLTATATVWWGARGDAERDAHADFDYRARELVNHVAVRMQAYVQVLYGVQGLFASSDFVAREEFRTYIERLELGQNFPGMQGVGFMRYVPGAQLEAHVATVRADGFPDYQVTPPGQRGHYSPVVYLEPFTGNNLLAFGYDALSEPVRRAALEQARDSGLPSMSGKLLLKQETADPVQAGFLIALPIYHNGQGRATLAQRRAALKGWVYAPFRMGDVMAALGHDALRGLHVEIYDGDEMNGMTSMFDSTPHNAGAEAPAARAAQRATKRLSLAGRRWTLQVSALPKADGVLSDQPRAIASGGIVLSVLLALLAYVLAESRQRLRGALERSGRMADELREGQATLLAMAEHAQGSQAVLRSILDSTVDGILVDNYRGTVLNSNRRFRQVWNVPEQLDWQNDGAILFGHMAAQLEQPELFMQAAACRELDDDECASQLPMRDGRVLELTMRPLRLGSEPARIWSFRDITERTLNERREEARHQVLELLAAGAPQQQVLDSLLRGLEAANPGMLCTVMLLDEDGQHLLVAAAPSLPAFFNDALHNQPVGYGNGSCGKAVSSNSRVIVEDIRSDPLWLPFRELAARAGLGACWSEPVRGANGKVLGAFAIYHREPQRPSVAHMTLIDQAASLAGIAIEQARAAQAVRAGEARFRSLYDHAPVALWQQDWSAVQRALQELAASGVEDRGQWLQNNPSQLQRLAALVRITDVNAAALAQVGADPASKQLDRLGLAQNFAPAALPVFAQALLALEQGQHLFQGEGSFLRLDGVQRQNELTLLVMPGHEHALDFVIVSTVDITERKRLNDELVQLATTDFLTGLPNRREFMARLESEQARLQRDVGGRAAVLMLDIDHFKDINDAHGHDWGDAVLRHLAGLMRDSQRKIDMLGRVGGEEFAILLPGADMEAARTFAERLRQRIADTPLQQQGRSIAITVSIGMAGMVAADRCSDAALVRADHALYRAKRGGRNRVES
ncbi:diguanylate cyclase [Pseudoduganella sp. DS3]|uniref:diguanylate cyclase n=1 Tax=Pseudoduganella guangdongensis TaxID=2692179 RepID=A0A6N9HH66_9BURK|nr:CHASE domain-containing protein [Pseudoduganella guangdongensis]MYN02699.1 diguanylate cyclase [Pseudoduganella guangdongensis]